MSKRETFANTAIVLPISPMPPFTANTSDREMLAEGRLWTIWRGHVRGAMVTNILKLMLKTRIRDGESRSLIPAGNDGHDTSRGVRISCTLLDEL